MFIGLKFLHPNAPKFLFIVSRRLKRSVGGWDGEQEVGVARKLSRGHWDMARVNFFALFLHLTTIIAAAHALDVAFSYNFKLLQVFFMAKWAFITFKLPFELSGSVVWVVVCIARRQNLLI